jgi:hypothetical protein
VKYQDWPWTTVFRPKSADGFRAALRPESGVGAEIAVAIDAQATPELMESQQTAATGGRLGLVAETWRAAAIRTVSD